MDDTTKAIRISYTDCYWLDVDGRQSITAKECGPFKVPHNFDSYDEVVHGIISHLLMDNDLPIYRLVIKENVPIEPVQRGMLEGLVELHNERMQQKSLLDDLIKASGEERDGFGRIII